MSRDLSDDMSAAIASNAITPAILLQIAFRSQTVYCWTGCGILSYGGNSYQGIGDLGKVEGISEGSAVSADGCTISLSGIDQVILGECLTDIQLGAPVTLSLALLDSNGNVINTPYAMFVGTVDQPVITPGLDTITISLKLENKLVNLQRSNQRRYTAADQNLYYPGDTFFNWVEQLNDQALKWT